MEHDLIGILEASEYECIDQVTLFLVAVTDGICKSEQEPELKELFTSYAERFKYVQQENSSSFRTETDVAYLKQTFVKSKSLEKYLFGAYQPSRMGTQK